MFRFLQNGLCLPLLGILFLLSPLAAKEPPAASSGDAQATVEEIRAVLDSIDPYLPGEDVAGEIDVFGSTSMDTLAHGWSIGFKKFHANINVVVSAEGSETVFDRLRKNPGSIGMLSRPVTKDDLEQLKQAGLKQPVAVMVAREALGVFVHRDNPLESISYAQAANAISAAKDPSESTWGALGLTGQYADQPIVVLGRKATSGTTKFVRDFLFRGHPLRKADKTFESNAKLIAELESNPYAIAVSGLKCGAHNAKALNLVVDDTVIPSHDHAILVGNYPLIRPLTLVLDAGRTSDQSAANREFARYALSQAGQMQAILDGFFPFDPPTLRAERMKIDQEHRVARKP